MKRLTTAQMIQDNFDLTPDGVNIWQFGLIRPNTPDNVLQDRARKIEQRARHLEYELPPGDAYQFLCWIRNVLAFKSVDSFAQISQVLDGLRKALQEIDVQPWGRPRA